MRKVLDFTGQRFGALVAIERVRRTLSSGRHLTAWKMVCDCGAEVVALTENIRKGKHKSCGCRYHLWPDGQKPVAAPNVDRRKLPKPRTGLTHWPEYPVYRQMRDRCYLQTAPNFRYYGALGVRVCDRWLSGEGGKTGFQCFIADMGRRPDGLTLDRIDPTGNYEPGNCRWASWEQQARNKRCHAA